MFIPINIDENSSEPLYAQITNQLRALILSGYLDEGCCCRRFVNLPTNCGAASLRSKSVSGSGGGRAAADEAGTGTFVAPVGAGERERYRKQAVEDALLEAIEAAIRVEMSVAELTHILEDLIRQKQMK